MHKAPDSNIAFSPAHLHIDMLESYQKKGWGRNLVSTAVEYMITKGLKGVWLGLDPRNEGARNFYKKLQFNTIAGTSDENQMGLRFTDFKSSNVQES
jgi:GNAT superfamily N-acetyltransferase